VRLVEEVAQGPVSGWGFAALLFGAGGIGTWVMKEAVRALRSRHLGHHLSVVEARAGVHDELERVRNGTAAARVTLMKSENGGGVPSADRQVRSTAMYDSVQRPLEPTAKNWDGVVADAPYAHVLASLVRDQQVQVLTTGLPEASRLRDKYTGEGVVRAVFQLVGTVRSGYMGNTRFRGHG
jgi:hypothetical protein